MMGIQVVFDEDQGNHKVAIENDDGDGGEDVLMVFYEVNNQ